MKHSLAEERPKRGSALVAGANVLLLAVLFALLALAALDSRAKPAFADHGYLGPDSVTPFND